MTPKPRLYFLSADEVLSHLITLGGAKARVMLEIHIETKGRIRETTERIVRENSNALGFDHASFDSD